GSRRALRQRAGGVHRSRAHARASSGAALPCFRGAGGRGGLMAALLFEIGAEELPGGFCAWAERELRDRLLQRLGGTGRVLVTPRRIAVVVEGFDPTAGGEERRGPAEAVAFSDGGPTKAAEGFARGLGLAVDELEVREGYVWGRAAPPPLEERLWQVVVT